MAERAFPKMLEKLGIKIDGEGKWDRSNEKFDDGLSDREKARVMARRNILSWRRENPTHDAQGNRIEWNLQDENVIVPGCPKRAQLSPELSGFPLVPDSDLTQSIKITPSSRKRPKGSAKARAEASALSAQEDDDEARASKYVKKQHFIEVGTKDSYTIIERAGVVHIVQYHDEDEDEDEE